jgi:hypothetical protein
MLSMIASVDWAMETVANIVANTTADNLINKVNFLMSLILDV